MIIKGDTYRDRSTIVITPSRGMIHADAVAGMLELEPIPGAKLARLVVWGHEVGHAYNEAFALALTHRAKYVLTYEDDMLPDPMALNKIMATMEAHPEFAAISALYRTKGAKSWPLVVGHPENIADRTPRAPYAPGDERYPIQEVNLIPFGFALWKLEMFEFLPLPWFETTTKSTHENTFSLAARKAGYRFAVDCSLKVGHLDVTDGKVY